MAEKVENLTLEYVRRLDKKVDALAADLKEARQAIGIVVGVVILVSVAIWAALLAVTIGFGVFGFVCIKLKRPLVSPHGSLAVPLIYSLLWASMLTLGLVLGSNQIASSMRLASPPPGIAREAVLFGVEAAIALFLPALVLRRFLAHGNVAIANIVLYAGSALTFSVSPLMLDATSAWQWAQTVLLDIVATLTFPIGVARALSEGPAAAFNQVYAWLSASNGSLFKLTAVLAKAFWLVAIYYAVRAWLRPLPQLAAATPRDYLLPEERKRFLLTLGAAAAFVAAVVWVVALVYFETAPGGTRSSPLFEFSIVLLMLTYVLLVVALWRSWRLSLSPSGS